MKEQRQEVKNQKDERLFEVPEGYTSINEAVNFIKKKLYREHLDYIALLSTKIKIDRMTKKLKREKFYLTKLRDSLKNELAVKDKIVKELKKSKSLEDKRRALEMESEIVIIVANCEIYRYAIGLKQKTIQAYEANKTINHQGIKRMRTKERHWNENMSWNLDEKY